MKKLLLTSILMMVGTSASAAVVVGDGTCTGTVAGNDRTCVKVVVCSSANRKCTITLDDSNLAVCLADQPEGRLVGALNTGARLFIDFLFLESNSEADQRHSQTQRQQPLHGAVDTQQF
jgi:hypothetical protein